ncbi:MAG TPA: UDP-N-acetylmuramoyl-L-alanine--D-glutamate ligase [Candidatus Hydrogenedentes bacterium]|nr:UDP-N-acetylmuramoyl-L-alanine--D-glutamate ligase [Candidatus Hydrogenedentota bacterium]
MTMDVHGKKVSLVGIGRTSVSLARLLKREGAEPFLTDVQSAQELAAFTPQLDEMGVAYEVGGHTARAFEHAALVIPSPGVPPGLPCIRAAREVGADVVSELEFSFPYCRSRILAVTGTNGKTTTTELLRCLVAACGEEVILAGNNATPFSTAVLADPAPPFMVLEISSYQLELARTFRPWIATVLNVTPDHLARHGSIEAYAAAKARIFACQQENDKSAINIDDPHVRAMASSTRGTIWQYSLSEKVDRGLWVRGNDICLGELHIADVSDTLLPGRHNLQNVLAALTMMYAGGFDFDDVLAGLRAFRGVEHRIEHVLERDGVDYFNDSKSTNIDSLRVALESFHNPVVLIAGGRGKGSDYAPLRELVQRHVKQLVCIGEDTPLLIAAFGDLVPVVPAESMEDAVQRAANAASTGDAVLLSPACASFDMFDNFEHRGAVFKECVRAIAQGALR